MLLRKYWMETRNRFFLGILFITALCLFFVLGQPWILDRWAMDEANDPAIYNPPWLLIAREDYTYFIWHFLYNYLLQFTCALFTVMLALGGLSHEQERGSAGFTLSLPISRGKLFFQRTAVGFVEVILLALLPSFIIPLSSSLIGLPFTWITALNHSVLFIGGGMVFYTLGAFINSLIKTESVGFFISLGLVIIFYFLFQPYSEGTPKPWLLKLINLPGFIAGDAKGSLFTRQQSAGFISCFLVSGILLTVSYLIIRKKDF